MKVKLQYEKKNFVNFAIVVIVALLLLAVTGYPWWMFLLFAGAYILIKSLHIELDGRVPWLWAGILFAGGSTLSTFSIQYMLLDQKHFMQTTPGKLFLNVCCCLVVYLTVQIFTGNAGLSCIISHIGLLLLGFINYFVYMFRQNEFIFSDLKAIGTGLSVAGGYTFSLDEKAAEVILWAILFVAFAGKCEVRFAEKWHMRIIAVMLGTLSCLWVTIETKRVNTETWEQKGSCRNGYILNFVLSVRDSFIQKPEEYSLEIIAELEERYTEQMLPVSGTVKSEDVEPGAAESEGTGAAEPTILVIMNESFADLGVLGELRTNEPVMPFIDSLEENTVKGYALSSVFGAKTPNSEWEYMTGNTMAFLPPGAVVYQQYLGEETASIVSDVKKLGYTCVAMHPYYDTGWRRNVVYPSLGYDEMYFLEDFDQNRLIRKYISDEELYDKIIQRYENRREGEKLFLMGITMQNHGGYTERYENFEEDIYKIGRSYTDANQYFSLVRESDRAVEKLVSYFAQVDEPVEIVFFGDHQPSLTSRFYPILNGKGLSGLTLQELENLYKVPFFIWTNYDSPEKNVELTSLNYLSTLTLQQAGIELPAYNRFLADLMEKVPAINSRGYYSLEQGEFLSPEEAGGEEAEWLMQYEMLQYNAMFDKKNRSRLFFAGQ